MAFIHIKHYPKVKDLIHPNIADNTDDYKIGNIYILTVYHGFGLRNRNGLNKRVDYKREEQCVLPINKPYWTRTKEKYKFKRLYNTRYQSEYNISYLSLVKGLYYDSHRTEIYAPRLLEEKNRLLIATACIHKDNLGKILKYLHPNTVSNIDRYKERHYYLFLSYHGSRYRHRNRTRKRIQYNKGEQCINPVQIFLWRPVKQKYLGNLIRLYMTRY